MIQLTSLTKSFGERVLLNDVSWTVSDAERVGLCGPNGAGKTTLLRMLAGFDEPDRGAIIRPSGLTIGYLPQDGIEHRGRTLFDEASRAFAALLDARNEIERIEHALADPSLPDGEHETLLVRYHDVSELFRQGEGHSIELRVTQVLEGLGFARGDFDKPVETFSGGWQMRVALAKLLLGRPTLLLLDEPTNHLDLDARNWLETFLVSYPHTVILVSHDRFFLDAVVTRIADLALSTITDYVGSYSRYLVEREAKMERLRKAKQEQDEEVARIRAFIDRFRYQATKAAQVQSRIKMLDKIVPIEVPPERKRVRFTFPACPKSGRHVLDLTDVDKAYGDNVVFRGISLHVERGDRIALVAPNGAGKSTLMRILATLQEADAGSIRLADLDVLHQKDEVRKTLGYLPQEFGIYPKVSAETLLDHFAVLKGLGERRVRREVVEALLRQTNLWDVRKQKLGSYSGGMRQRFGVAVALLGNPKLMIVDEPTAGLDPAERVRFLNLLAELGENSVVLLSTHIVEDVSELCTRMAIIDRGEILLEAEPLRAVEDLRGRIWRRVISKEALPAVERDHAVISTKLLAGRTVVHVYSDTAPGAEFEPSAPDLEDVYFSTMARLHQRSGGHA
jgi:ATP-binding cassette subfamily F protein 3